jgi:hypothetical protein
MITEVASEPRRRRRLLFPHTSIAEAQEILDERIQAVRDHFRGHLINEALVANVEAALREVTQEFTACGFEVREMSVEITGGGSINVYTKPTPREIEAQREYDRRLAEAADRAERRWAEERINSTLLEAG